MGLFDIFGGNSGEKALRKHAKHAGNKRAQAIDRWESIQALAKMGSAEAVEALLPRFTFYTDPSITDQEEKDAAFSGVIAAGDVGVPAVKKFLRSPVSLAWPLKMLDKLLSEDAVRAELLAMLAEMDTEYERDPEKKLDILAALADRKGPEVAEAVQRFLKDVNETARFNSIAAMLAQDDEAGAVKQTLLEHLGSEESMRVKVRVLEACKERGWQVEAEGAGQLPAGWSIGEDGLPTK